MKHLSERIKVEVSYEELQRKLMGKTYGRITANIIVDGEVVGTCHIATGPAGGVEAFYKGEIDLNLLRKEMGMRVEPKL